MKALEGVLRDESAATLTEYALLLALIAVAAIFGLQKVYEAVSATLNHVSDTLTKAQAGP